MWLLTILAVWAVLAQAGAAEVAFYCLIFAPEILVLYLLIDGLIHGILRDR